MKNIQEKLIVFCQVVIKTIGVLLFLFTIGCKDNRCFIKKEFYDTGEIYRRTSFIKNTNIKEGEYREYYKNGNIKKTINYKNNRHVDSSMFYNESGILKFKELIRKDTVYSIHYHLNGNVLLKSKFINGILPIKIGWEEKFNIYGALTDSLEYVKIGNESFLNQRKKIEKKQVNADSSFFYNMRISKIINSKFYQLKINYTSANKKAKVFMILSDSLNFDFNNLNQVKLDTLFMKNNRLITRSLKKNHRHLKGFFYEYYPTVKEVYKDSVRFTIEDKKVFFNKKIIVSDTIK